jgi:hypothetical protein
MGNLAIWQSVPGSAGFARMRTYAKDTECMIRVSSQSRSIGGRRRLSRASLTATQQTGWEKRIMRKKTWIALGTTLLSCSLAHAQGMMPGYPGYGYPPPLTPYTMPMSRPTLPTGAFPQGYDGVGPKAGASEPYLVPSETSQAPGSPKKVLTLPPAEAPGATTTTMMPVEPMDPMEMIGPPSEPYTVYEGPRSLAEVKQDDRRVWAQADFIHWYIRRDNTPPLVTTGNPGAVSPGALGNSDTVILLGNGSIGPNEFSGGQATIGMWLDEERLNGVELSGFFLGKNSRQYSFSSDGAGNPALSQPIIVGGVEHVLQIATPGTVANPVDLVGKIGVSTVLNFNGAEANYILNLARTGGFTFDVLAGVRYMYMNEQLGIDQTITTLPGANFQIPFLGVPQPAGTNFAINDSFNVTNRYYGGQVGARVDWAWRSLDISALMKIGAGATNSLFIIDGSSTLNAINGTHVTVPGGTLTQLSNIGRYSSTEFSVVPELTLTAGYQFTPTIRLTAGYTLLYWTHVMRVGNNIDRNVDPGQVPTAAFPTITPGTQPGFPAIRTDFWAQGVNVGMELKY